MRRLQSVQRRFVGFSLSPTVRGGLVERRRWRTSGWAQARRGCKARTQDPQRRWMSVVRKRTAAKRPAHMCWIHRAGVEGDYSPISWCHAKWRTKRAENWKTCTWRSCVPTRSSTPTEADATCRGALWSHFQTKEANSRCLLLTSSIVPLRTMERSELLDASSIVKSRSFVELKTQQEPFHMADGRRLQYVAVGRRQLNVYPGTIASTLPLNS